MKHYIVVILAALICTGVSAKTKVELRASEIFKSGGFVRFPPCSSANASAARRWSGCRVGFSPFASDSYRIAAKPLPAIAHILSHPSPGREFGFDAGISNNGEIEPVFNAHDLSITWECLQNNYQNKGQSLNELTLTNNGKNTLPATGWKMFFNDAGMLLPATVTGNAKIDFINGDLFSLTPTATFTEIKPGASIQIQFLAEDPVVNITDGPDGFYVVWDSQPDKGYNTAGLTIKPFKPNYVGLITPAIIYDQNKNIADMPEAQLTKVFPTPVSYKETGGYFKLNSKTGISGDTYFEKK